MCHDTPIEMKDNVLVPFPTPSGTWGLNSEGQAGLQMSLPVKQSHQSLSLVAAAKNIHWTPSHNMDYWGVRSPGAKRGLDCKICTHYRWPRFFCAFFSLCLLPHLPLSPSNFICWLLSAKRMHSIPMLNSQRFQPPILCKPLCPGLRNLPWSDMTTQNRQRLENCSMKGRLPPSKELNFWGSFSGCLQQLGGSALLPCLRQSPKCLTTRHTILGHCGGSPPSPPPHPGRPLACRIWYVFSL